MEAMLNQTACPLPPSPVQDSGRTEGRGGGGCWLKIGLHTSEPKKDNFIFAIGNRTHRRQPVEAPARDDLFVKVAGRSWVVDLGSGRVDFVRGIGKADIPLRDVRPFDTQSICVGLHALIRPNNREGNQLQNDEPAYALQQDEWERFVHDVPRQVKLKPRHHD
jgi:hypothetical protein